MSDISPSPQPFLERLRPQFGSAEVKLFADLCLANSTPTPVSGEWAPQSVARTSRLQF